MHRLIPEKITDPNFSYLLAQWIAWKAVCDLVASLRDVDASNPTTERTIMLRDVIYSYAQKLDREIADPDYTLSIEKNEGLRDGYLAAVALLSVSLQIPCPPLNGEGSIEPSAFNEREDVSLPHGDHED